MIKVRVCGETYTETGTEISFDNTNGDKSIQSVIIGLDSQTEADAPVQWESVTVSITNGTDTQSVVVELPSGIYSGSLDLFNGKLTSNGEEYDVTPQKIYPLDGVNTVSAVPCGTATRLDVYDGYIVEITNNGYSEVTDLTVTLEPQQEGSGTPSPTNVRPISGTDEVRVYRTGKNLLNPSYRSNLNQNIRLYYGTGILLKANTAYTFSVSSASAQNSITEIGGGNLVANYGRDSLTYTPPRDVNVWIDAYYAGNYPAPSGGTASVDCQLELGTTATAYEPYNGTTYTTALGQTVYGGTLDVTSGVLTVTDAMLDMGTLNWTKGNRNTADTGTIFYNRNYNEYKSEGTILSSAFETVTGLPNWEALGVGQCISAAGSYVVFCADYDSAAAFKTAMSGVQLVYELATPQTYTLTPSEVTLLVGENVLWSNGDSITVNVETNTPFCGVAEYEITYADMIDYDGFMCGGKRVPVIVKCSGTRTMMPIVAGENEVHIPNVECEEPAKRTVLYSDGMLIINELPEDRRTNASLHGEVVNEWDAYDADTNPYLFEVLIGRDVVTQIEVVEGISGRPWDDYVEDILSVSFGEMIAPTQMNGWFGHLPNLQLYDFRNLNFTNVESTVALFAYDGSLTGGYAPHFEWEEPQLTYTNHMFNGCSSIETINLCDFILHGYTYKIENCAYMFNNCTSVRSIFSSENFPQTADGTNMFRNCENVVGRNGTTYDSTNVGIGMAVIDTQTAQGYFGMCGIE